MDDNTGRCAILFPHGVLFRKEEQELRKALIETDLIECVIGLGANLFYNSPMEACIIICNKNKSVKGKVIFINAVNEVVRKNAESCLTDEHIEKIRNAYFNHADIQGFCKVVPNDEIKNADLNISLYASPQMNMECCSLSIEESISNWQESSANMHNCFTTLTSLING